MTFSTELRADTVEDQVKDIRTRYNLIEGGKFRTSKIEFEGQDEPVTGSCTLHFQGDAIVKIHLSHGADHGASDEYFYYEGGNLFFVYASDGAWRFTGETLANGESETIDSVVEHRVYLWDGKVIRHLSKEASSKVPASLPGLVAKAENKPSTDAERTAQLLRHGSALTGVRTGADLEKVILSGE